MQGSQVPGVVPLVSKVEPVEQLINPSTPMSNKKRNLDSGPNSPEDEGGVKGGMDDEKLAKKQRRLVKNREAAAQFRHRQKAYMQKLEKHAEELTLSNVQVTAKIELLDTENKLMKEQLSYLRNFMKQAVALSFPNSLPSLPPDSDLSTQPIIPDLFPDDTDNKNNININNNTAIPPVIKTEPMVVVPDITNPSSLPSSPPTIVPSSIPTPSSAMNPPIISPVPVPMAMPSFIPPSPISSSPSSSSTVPTISPPPSPLPIPHLPPSSSSTSSIPSTSPTNNSLITSTNLLNDPFLSSMMGGGNSNNLLGSSSTLSSSANLSSIFNSILGTDLSFSGVLVKTEPSDNSNNNNSNH